MKIAIKRAMKLIFVFALVAYSSKAHGDNTQYNHATGYQTQLNTGTALSYQTKMSSSGE